MSTSADEPASRFRWGYAAALTAAAALGFVLSFPYEWEVEALNADPPGVLVWKPWQLEVSVVYSTDTGVHERWYVHGAYELFLKARIKTTLLFPIIILGLKLGTPVGLGWPPISGSGSRPGAGARRLGRITKTLLLSAALGAACFVLVLAERVLLGLMAANPTEGKGYVEPFWLVGLAASYGAGVCEEILLRLGFLTFVVWGLTRLARQVAAGPRTAWAGILVASLLFGIMHLPATSGLIGLTAPVIAQVLSENGVLGVVFGWLYWRKGLIAAMTAHISQDVVTHVLFRLAATWANARR
jgi:membrane protease YdiL (CAAX protease family)